MTGTADPRSVIETGLAELAIAAPESALDSLAKLSVLVADWGKRINLTGHRTPESIARRLVLDAAALLAALPSRSFQSLADLGTGAGFPGLPIAVLCPQARVLLIDSRERRHHFQRHAIRELALENVVALRGRFDELEAERCEVVVAQAVAGPAQLTGSLLRWAQPGALLVVPGGTSAREGSELAGLDVRTIDYQVPLQGPARTLWTATLR